MADFIAQNHIQNRHRVQVAHLAQLGLNAGRDVQPARFQRARHQRQPRQQVVGGALGHVPQAVVSRKIPVLVAQGVQVGVQQLKMLGFFLRHAQPVAVKRLGQAGKAPDDVQRQVNGVEFDMRQRVDQRGAAFLRAQAALGQLAGRNQLWAGRSAGQRRRRGEGKLGAAGCGKVQRGDGAEFGGQFGQRQRVTGGQAKRGGRHGKSVNRGQVGDAARRVRWPADRHHSKKCAAIRKKPPSLGVFCCARQVLTSALPWPGTTRFPPRCPGSARWSRCPLPPATWRSPGDRTGLGRRCRHTCSGGGRR